MHVSFWVTYCYNLNYSKGLILFFSKFVSKLLHSKSFVGGSNVSWKCLFFQFLAILNWFSLYLSQCAGPLYFHVCLQVLLFYSAMSSPSSSLCLKTSLRDFMYTHLFEVELQMYIYSAIHDFLNSWLKNLNLKCLLDIYCLIHFSNSPKFSLLLSYSFNLKVLYSCFPC